MLLYSVKILRAWFSGRTSASQALDASSILAARTKLAKRAWGQAPDRSSILRTCTHVLKAGAGYDFDLGTELWLTSFLKRVGLGQTKPFSRQERSCHDAIRSTDGSAARGFAGFH